MWGHEHSCSHCAQGLALTHVLEQNLKPRAGLRPEAAKLVILVTDGKSQDDAHAAGHVLKGLGVDIFAVGEQLPTRALSGHSHRTQQGGSWLPKLQVLWPLSLSTCSRPPTPSMNGRKSPCSEDLSSHLDNWR